MPLKRLIYAFTTVRGNIHLEFLTETEATEVFEKWEPTFLGNQSKIRRANEVEKPNKTVIVKKVPTDIDDSEIALSIQNNHSFDDVKVTKFIKLNQTKLETVKINFKTVNDVEKALNEGLFIDSLFYKPTRFERRALTIIRCFNCQKFGHIILNCKSSQSCGHCSGNHSYIQCSKSEPPKCDNCHGNHPADSTDCPTYLKQVFTVYNARGIPIPVSAQQRIESLGNKINET